MDEVRYEIVPGEKNVLRVKRLYKGIGALDTGPCRSRPRQRLPYDNTERMSEAVGTFEFPILVEYADIDEIGHVNNVTYVRWVQDAAVAHWKAAAPADELARLLWIVLRHEIDYKQAAYWGDDIVAKTWVGAASQFRFERHTEIIRLSDRCVLARARTIWCPIDTTTRRPTLVTPEVRTRFSVAEGDPR
ncbi:MAG: thioesterase family protein [Bryobacteraceae bacterium]